MFGGIQIREGGGFLIYIGDQRAQIWVHENHVQCFSVWVVNNGVQRKKVPGNTGETQGLESAAGTSS